MMHILTGVVVSLLLMSLLFLWAYSDRIETKRDEIIVNICAAVAGCSLMFGILLVGHWVAVLLGGL